MSRKKAKKRVAAPQGGENHASEKQTEEDIRHDTKEIAHFRDVRSYTHDAGRSNTPFSTTRPTCCWSSIADSMPYDILPDRYKQMLPADVWNAKQLEFKNCILENARFLALQFTASLTY